MKASLSSIVYDLAINGKINEPLSQEMMDCFRKLAGMANNLNQLTRLANAKGLTAVRVRHAAIVTAIEKLLKQICDDR